MRAQLLAFFISSTLLFNAGCGSSTDQQKNDLTTPPLPFTQVAASVPLTSSTLANSLVFASDVPASQVATLKQDLSVIDNWDGLMTTEETSTITSLIGISNPTPQALSAWLKQRIKYILPADISNYEIGLVFPDTRQVGLQTFGPTSESDDANTGGGNIGTAIYLTTLDEQKSRPELSYIIIRVNDQWVPVLSPEVGLMRIGPALFAADFQVNHTNLAAVSNSMQRLEVLFHEARHSDGNSANGSVGFPHINCPAVSTIPAELQGIPACDDTTNGAYSVGAAILKPLFHICDRQFCSDTEKTVLQAIYLDRLSRVNAGDGALKTLDPTPETGFNTINFSDFDAFNLR